MSENKPKYDKDDLSLLSENVEGFMLPRLDDTSKDVQVVAHKDKDGDYPVLQFHFEDSTGEKMSIALDRDQLSAITFALSRQDQQSKLLTGRFRQYKEVPVRLVVRASKDIKKDELVIIWRKEKVPLDFEYTYEKGKTILT